jgi:hypothetical protein
MVRHRNGSKVFFSEEKRQKTFKYSVASRYPAMACHHSPTPKIKVFCFFSSEKKTLLSLDPTGYPRHKKCV